ncbi:MAG: Smr/MutS family protein [Tannerella sp.]|nr:Smr/MutS family protein [Tannerella sp.]
MIYPDNFEQKTEFNRIRLLIDNKCLSSLGKERVEAMSFLTDIAAISEKLEQTDEFVRILTKDGAFSIGYFTDLRNSLGRIRPEGTFLDERELFDVKRSLQTISDITHFFKSPASDSSRDGSRDGEEIKYPALTRLSAGIPVFPKLISGINEILDKYGNIKDNASPELVRIRKEMTSTMSSISRNLQSILRAAQADGFVDKDVAPTMRDGRLVIPVSPAFKRKIKGIVHDESASGKTVFIEPETVVDANNRIRELESEEKREIVRILTACTDTIRVFVPEILQSFDFIAEVDFIRAKALFSIETNGSKPAVENRPFIDWNKAVHPLLFLSLKRQDKAVVPLDIELNDDERILIISGPNAGGKSVCLKTVGLLQYMLQCGLLIPVGERSRAGVFNRLFIDIGDEQSIENDLSTYSSHLANMKFFVKNGDRQTLILVDEFGSGTEPVIGGALAEALLERFNRNGCMGVITTHYQNLKQFAESHEGVVNGAMMYDRHLMQPLFRLSVGLPGSSFAVEIARKIGLPEDVIADASEKVGSDYIDMDKYLQDIIRDRRYWETKRQNIRQQEKKLEEVTAKYESDLEAVNLQRKEILKAAKTEAAQILSEANARIENTIREIKEAQAEKERTKSARAELETFKKSVSGDTADDARISIRGGRGKLHGHGELRSNGELHGRGELRGRDELHGRRVRKGQPNPVSSDEAAIVKGDSVRIKGQTAVGTVMDVMGKQAVVTFGVIKSTIKTEVLEKVTGKDAKKELRQNTFISAGTAEAMHEKILNFKHDIDVRGMRGDEALQTVAYFIDDAILANVSPVRILHGTGGGILRQLIREYLSTAAGVKQFRDEHIQFGGSGITVVEIS